MSEERKLEGLAGWHKEGNYIVREYSTKNCKESVFLFNTIAGLAEAYWHHPDIEVSFKRVRVKLTTHEVGGITEKDIRLAQEIEKIATLLLK